MATSDILSLTGIVLRVTPVKESDAMVNCIGPDGFFSFYAHGAKKLTSKNASSLQMLTKADFTLRKSSSGSLTLQESSRGRSLQEKEGSLETMAIGQILAEVALKLVQDEEARDIYPYLNAALEAIMDDKDPYSAGLIYFAHVLSLIGIGLDISECVSCSSKKDIYAMSYEEGGFLCKECAQELGVSPTPLQQLKILRYIFKIGLEDIGKVKLEPALSKAIYHDLATYVENLTGVSLNSVRFLQQI